MLAYEHTLVSMARIGTDEMSVRGRVNPNIEFSATHLYTWVERNSFGKVSCPRPQLLSRLKPGQPGADPENSQAGGQVPRPLPPPE